MSVYCDASLLVALFTVDHFADRARQAARAVDGFIVSDFASAEFSSTMAKLVRIGDLSLDDAQTACEVFDDWAAHFASRIQIRPEDIAQAEAYVRRFDLNLRAPDAIHLATAVRLNAPLATFDDGMTSCARILGVTLAEV